MTDGLVTVGVVVVNFGSSHLLEANLVPTADGCPGAVVVVVDNYVDACERRAVEQLCARHGWELVAPDRNLGFGAGANRGAARAIEFGADALLLLNPDASIDGDSLRILRQTLAGDPLTMLSPLVVRPDGTIWFSGNDLLLDSGTLRTTRRRPGDSDEPVETWLSGACLMVGRALWERVGGFDERYFLYWEDVDLSHRVRLAGGELAVVETARAIHDEGGTQRRLGRAMSSTYYYYNIRNRLLFAALHLDGAGRRRWALTSPRAAYDILMRGGRRQFLHRPWDPVRAAVRGTVNGLALLRRPIARHEAATGNADTRAPSGARPLVVLQSFQRPRPTTNPYITMLGQQLTADPRIELRTFSWVEALTRRHDVFHAHWPEILVSGGSPLKKLVRQVLFLLLLVNFRVHRTAVVRTMHNLEPPQGISRREVALLRLFEHETDALIRVNSCTPMPAGTVFETILHGHYRPWYEPYPRSERVPGRIGYFGLIRRYKGVEALVGAFRETSDPGLSLTVGGKPSTEDLGAGLRALSAPDERVRLTLRFLDDSELVTAVGESELVVLPYREMHNSGSALTTLSLDRPVLMPDNEVNRGLQNEVGPYWVHLYQGPLTADLLVQTLARVRAGPDDEGPDLSARGWDGTADRHLAAYRRAVASVRDSCRGRRPRTRAPGRWRRRASWGR